MANDLGTGKTVIVLAVVISCFAVLWPRIFYPMLQTTVSTPKADVERNVNPSMMHPRLREAMKSAPLTPVKKESTRMPFGAMPQANMVNRPVKEGGGRGPKGGGGGAMGFIMPIYTIAIVVFFIYTIFKLLTRNADEEEVISSTAKPLLKDFQMDPEHRKFLLSERYDDRGVSLTTTSSNSTGNFAQLKGDNRWTGKSPDLLRQPDTFAAGGKEAKNSVSRGNKMLIRKVAQDNNSEMGKLRRRLEEKEAAMTSLLKKMNYTSSTLVDTGILPSIPGLFTGHGETDKPSMSNTAVSDALRALIRDMETFKTYLVQVDDSRNKLARVEVEAAALEAEAEETEEDELSSATASESQTDLRKRRQAQSGEKPDSRPQTRIGVKVSPQGLNTIDSVEQECPKAVNSSLLGEPTEKPEVEESHGGLSDSATTEEEDERSECSAEDVPTSTKSVQTSTDDIERLTATSTLSEE